MAMAISSIRCEIPADFSRCSLPSTVPGGSEQDPKLVQVLQHVGNVAVHAEGPGVVEFLLAVPARQNADAKHAGPAGAEVVPDSVADDDTILHASAKSLPARQKE